MTRFVIDYALTCFQINHKYSMFCLSLKEAEREREREKFDKELVDEKKGMYRRVNKARENRLASP